MEENNKSSKQRGGSRPNAGRPPKGEDKFQQIGFRADKKTREILAQHLAQGGNFSSYIRNAIKFYDEYKGYHFLSPKQYEKIKRSLLNYGELLDRFDKMQREEQSSIGNYSY